LSSNVHVTRDSDQNDEAPNKRVEASPRMSAVGRFLPSNTTHCGECERLLVGESCRSKNRSNVLLVLVHELLLLAESGRS
jgi:hypothetical protein